MQTNSLEHQIKTHPEISNKLPKLARQVVLRFTTGDIMKSSLIDRCVQTIKDINVDRLIKAYGSIIGEFNVLGIKYSYMELERLIEENEEIPKTSISDVANVIRMIMDCLAQDVTSFYDYSAWIKPKANPVLKRYIDTLEAQTYVGVWSDIMKYPFDNQFLGIKKHLMIGFASNTGKSIIIKALNNLYAQVSRITPNRPKFDFDAGVWNANVADSFLVLIDDDNAEAHVSEDYIKNFLNRNMPLNLAAGGGKRWQQKFNGSSVIATNTEEDYYHETANDKRIALLRIDEPLTGFTSDELAYLHDLPVADILGYVDNSRPTKLFSQQNAWDRTTENAVKNYLGLIGAASNRSLCAMFGKQEVKQALGKAKTITFGGKTVYGYKIDKSVNQNDDSKFSIAIYESLTTKKPTITTSSLAEFKQGSMSVADMPKETQPLFNLVKGTSTREQDISEATGVVLDIDESKFSSLDEINLDYTYIAYETSSSQPGALRYRIVIPNIESHSNDEYKANVARIADDLGDKIDESGHTIAHRFFLGGSKFRINLKGAAPVDLPNTNNDGIIDRVRNAVKGERNNVTYWALERAAEKNDSDLIQEILSVSPCPENEIAEFRKRYLI